MEQIKECNTRLEIQRQAALGLEWLILEILQNSSGEVRYRETNDQVLNQVGEREKEGQKSETNQEESRRIECIVQFTKFAECKDRR